MIICSINLSEEAFLALLARCAKSTLDLWFENSPSGQQKASISLVPDSKSGQGFTFMSIRFLVFWFVASGFIFHASIQRAAYFTPYSVLRKIAFRVHAWFSCATRKCNYCWMPGTESVVLSPGSPWPSFGSLHRGASSRPALWACVKNTPPSLLLLPFLYRWLGAGHWRTRSKVRAFRRI